MRVVVTGASGLVGHVTVRGLEAAGHQVLATDRVEPRVKGAAESFRRVNAGDYEALLDVCAGADAIVHLAGISKPEGYPPHEVHNNNVASSYNVLCVAVELGIARVVMASSVNAIGLTWSRAPVFDYFPVDHHHATRNEDAYSLSKWAGEQQADSVARRHPGLSIASLRLHMFMPDRAEAQRQSSGALADSAARGLWGYTTHAMWVQACQRALVADSTGHEILFVVADRTVREDSSTSAAQTYYPGVPLREAMVGNAGFFDCRNTKAVLGWSGGE